MLGFKWKDLTGRGKLCYTLTIINIVLAIIQAMGHNLMCIFSFLIGVVCWLGLFDRRSHVRKE